MQAVIFLELYCRIVPFTREMNRSNFTASYEHSDFHKPSTYVPEVSLGQGK